jgi:hypothetical protein
MGIKKVFLIDFLYAKCGVIIIEKKTGFLYRIECLHHTTLFFLSCGTDATFLVAFLALLFSRINQNENSSRVLVVLYEVTTTTTTTTTVMVAGSLLRFQHFHFLDHHQDDFFGSPV